MFPEGFFAAAGEAIILMLVAAILAGVIVYLLMRSRYLSLQNRYESMAGKYGDLDQRYQILQGQYNAVQPKYQALEDELERKNAELLSSQKIQMDLQRQLSATPVVDDSDWKAELASQKQALSDCESSQQALKAKIEGLETALRAAEARLAEAEAPAEAESRALPLSDPSTAEAPEKQSKTEKEAATLARIQERAQEINFDRIGVATEADKDDLKLVKGIGPFIEKKLNSIGIYTFRQIANFTAEDEDKVNEVIEFFPGRIRRDNWSGQSEEFADQKDKKQKNKS